MQNTDKSQNPSSSLSQGENNRNSAKKKPFIPNLKKLSQNPQRLASGHRLCPGCGIGVILKQALTTIDNPVVVANATGCSEICFSPYPQNAFKVPWIHSVFENCSSVLSGVESAWKSFNKRNKLTENQKKIKFLAVGGDGATYDIGFQWLSGAIERGHDFTYICFDNEGYMNTGYQRSSATTVGFATHTSPVGKKIVGKLQHRKNLTRIMAAHNAPYVAQINPANSFDLMKKAKKAFETKGPSFLNAFSMCPTNWKYSSEQGIDISALATESGLWPLYEVHHGKWKITYKPKASKTYREKNEPLEKFLSMQGRTKHLLKPENREILQDLMNQIADDWDYLLKMEEAFPLNS